MFANRDIAELLQIADAYAAHTGHRLSTVSLRAAASGSLLPKLAEGAQGLTIRRRDNILKWFSTHWPDDLPWPADIPRPAPTQSEDAA